MDKDKTFRVFRLPLAATNGKVAPVAVSVNSYAGLTYEEAVALAKKSLASNPAATCMMLSSIWATAGVASR